MEKINLYIDFDGVILDTIPVLNQALIDAGLSENDSQEEIRDIFTNYPWHTIVDDKLILNDSINSIEKLIDSEKFDIAILTHVNSLNEAIEKIKYLRKYFRHITIIPCPKELSKTQIVYPKGAILVDDYPENLKEWESEEGIPVRFSLKGNGKGFKVVKKLDELIDMF